MRVVSESNHANKILVVEEGYSKEGMYRRE